jgi:hypothetical protein
MPLHLKLKRKAAYYTAKNMDENVIKEFMQKEKIKHCQANFKAQTRNQVIEVEKQKHLSPPMNLYNCKFDLIRPNNYKVIPFNIVPQLPNQGSINKNKAFV